MPRKNRNKEERYAGWTEEEWRDWGEKFGKRMEKRGRDFGEEIADLSERFGRRMERRERKRYWKDWWFSTFGFIGPLFGSIAGTVFLVIGIWILNLLNFFIASSFLTAVSSFFLTNIGWFFAIFLFSGYNDYFSRRYPDSYWIISPITTAVSFVIAIWFLTWALVLINTVPKIQTITTLTNFLSANRDSLFVIVLVLGYVIVFIKKLIVNVLGD